VRYAIFKYEHSQDSEMMYLRCGRSFTDHCIAKVLLGVPVKEFLQESRANAGEPRDGKLNVEVELVACTCMLSEVAIP